MHKIPYSSHHYSPHSCCEERYAPYYNPYHCYAPPEQHCPACCMPASQCCCVSVTVIKYPQELFAAGTSTADTFTGGVSDVFLTLEYISDNIATSSVEVRIDSVSVITLPLPPSGYQVKKIPVPVPPGSVVELVVADAKARLRWCEEFHC